jgi:pyruvate dehydrogenase E2 component (dihydrolipoamide acetyltransferase)
MAIEVKLPELGDGIESGDVLDVLVNEGDVIAKDQAICELETDKATVEVPSPQAGKVVKVHIASGQTVPIGAMLLTLEVAESAEASAPAAPVPDSQPAAQPDPDEPAATDDEPSSPVTTENSEDSDEAAALNKPSQPTTPEKPAKPTATSAPAASESAETGQQRAADAKSQPTPPSPNETSASPAVSAKSSNESGSNAPAAAGPAIRRLAREVGIDLDQLTGTGTGGRITRDDVLAAVRRGGTTARSAPAAESAPAPGQVNGDADQAPAPASTTTTAASTTDDWGPIRVERMTKIRKTIAARMHDSWLTVPRVTNFDDADVTELERIRQASKSDYAARGIKLTSMAFVIKAVALALRNNPVVNAAIDEDNEQIIYKQYINVGIAVDTERGLVVPSLRKPDELRIPDIARSLSNIADNARNNNFKLEDLRGSTFTISNLGAVGGRYSTPIVSVPEVAILLLGRTRREAIVMDDNQVAARLMMPLSLSYDHRLVDGAAAARFLNGVIEYLENPSRLLIAP